MTSWNVNLLFILFSQLPQISQVWCFDAGRHFFFWKKICPRIYHTLHHSLFSFMFTLFFYFRNQYFISFLQYSSVFFVLNSFLFILSQIQMHAARGLQLQVGSVKKRQWTLRCCFEMIILASPQGNCAFLATLLWISHVPQFFPPHLK